MADNNTNILSIEMAQIKLPDAKERLIANSKYVRYGDDNLFNMFLENLRDNAPLHGAILTSKLEQAFAKGLDFDTNDLSFKLFHAHCNTEEGLDDVYYKLLTDLILYGGFYIEVIWDNDGKLSQMYHLPFSKIRAGRKDSKTHKIEEYFYCEDWFKVYTYGYTPIPVVDFTNRTGRQIFVYRSYVAGREYYPLPDYVSSLAYIALEKEISNYNLSEIRNSFGGANVINFKNGVPSEEEQQSIKHKIERQLTGSDNAGKLLVTWSPSAETAPDIVTLTSSDAADKYVSLEKSVLENVLCGHRVISPLLCGIRTENNGLGNNANELENAFELWHNTVIKPYQEKVIKALNTLIMCLPNYNGITLKPTINSPITFTFSESTLAQILTQDELREKIGYDKLEN